MEHLMKVELSAEDVASDLAKVRAVSPLVHNVTNLVVMKNTADALLAVGASAVMAHAIEEVGEMVSKSDALVLNIGTLDAQWLEAVREAGQEAAVEGVPIVLDPVGVGMTEFRMHSLMDMMEYFTPDILRGNPSEIAAFWEALSGEFSGCRSRGVDSLLDVESARESAVNLARRLGCVVSVSGSTDFITDGVRYGEVHNGSVMMTRVSGMGCTASALSGAFAAVCDDRFRAAVSAMAVNGMAGEAAALRSRGNGSFQVNFLDELYDMNAATAGKMLR